MIFSSLGLTSPSIRFYFRKHRVTLYNTASERSPSAEAQLQVQPNLIRWSGTPDIDQVYTDDLTQEQRSLLHNQSARFVESLAYIPKEDPSSSFTPAEYKVHLLKLIEQIGNEKQAQDVRETIGAKQAWMASLMKQFIDTQANTPAIQLPKYNANTLFKGRSIIQVQIEHHIHQKATSLASLGYSITEIVNVIDNMKFTQLICQSQQFVEDRIVMRYSQLLLATENETDIYFDSVNLFALEGVTMT